MSDPFGIHERDQLQAAERDAHLMSRRIIEHFNDGEPGTERWVSGFTSPIIQRFKEALESRNIRMCSHITSPQPMMCNFGWVSMKNDKSLVTVCMECADRLSQQYAALYRGQREEFMCDMCRTHEPAGLNMLSIPVGITMLVVGLCTECRAREDAAR